MCFYLRRAGRTRKSMESGRQIDSRCNSISLLKFVNEKTDDLDRRTPRSDSNMFSYSTILTAKSERKDFVSCNGYLEFWSLGEGLGAAWLQKVMKNKILCLVMTCLLDGNITLPEKAQINSKLKGWGIPSAFFVQPKGHAHRITPLCIRRCHVFMYVPLWAYDLQTYHNT